MICQSILNFTLAHTCQILSAYSNRGREEWIRYAYYLPDTSTHVFHVHYEHLAKPIKVLNLYHIFSQSTFEYFVYYPRGIAFFPRNCDKSDDFHLFPPYYSGNHSETNDEPISFIAVCRSFLSCAGSFRIPATTTTSLTSNSSN